MRRELRQRSLESVARLSPSFPAILSAACWTKETRLRNAFRFCQRRALSGARSRDRELRTLRIAPHDLPCFRAAGAVGRRAECLRALFPRRVGEEIAACEMKPDPDDLESRLLEELEKNTGTRGNTIIAFAWRPESKSGLLFLQLCPARVKFVHFVLRRVQFCVGTRRPGCRWQLRDLRLGYPLCLPTRVRRPRRDCSMLAYSRASRYESFFFEAAADSWKRELPRTSILALLAASLVGAPPAKFPTGNSLQNVRRRPAHPSQARWSRRDRACNDHALPAPASRETRADFPPGFRGWECRDRWWARRAKERQQAAASVARSKRGPARRLTIARQAG